MHLVSVASVHCRMVTLSSHLEPGWISSPESVSPYAPLLMSRRYLAPYPLPSRHQRQGITR